jgi:hypothetical protein
VFFVPSWLKTFVSSGVKNNLLTPYPLAFFFKTKLRFTMESAPLSLGKVDLFHHNGTQLEPLPIPFTQCTPEEYLFIFTKKSFL